MSWLAWERVGRIARAEEGVVVPCMYELMSSERLHKKASELKDYSPADNTISRLRATTLAPRERPSA